MKRCLIPLVAALLAGTALAADDARQLVTLPAAAQATLREEMQANLLTHPCGPHLSQPAPATLPDNPWFGDPALPKTRAAIDKANLYPYLATVNPRPAFFIFHGDEDCSVNSADSIELDARLRSLGAQSSLTLIPHAGHGDAKVWAAAASVGSVLRSLFTRHG